MSSPSQQNQHHQQQYNNNNGYSNNDGRNNELFQNRNPNCTCVCQCCGDGGPPPFDSNQLPPPEGNFWNFQYPPPPRPPPPLLPPNRYPFPPPRFYPPMSHQQPREYRHRPRRFRSHFNTRNERYTPHYSRSWIDRRTNSSSPVQNTTTYPRQPPPPGTSDVYPPNVRENLFVENGVPSLPLTNQLVSFNSPQSGSPVSECGSTTSSRFPISPGCEADYYSYGISSPVRPPLPPSPPFKDTPPPPPPSSPPLRPPESPPPPPPDSPPPPPDSPPVSSIYKYSPITPPVALEEEDEPGSLQIDEERPIQSPQSANKDEESLDDWDLFISDLDREERHGRVQSVKLLSDENSSPSPGNGVRSLTNGAGQRATVSFIDIRSASKALRAGPTLSGQTLQIAYHEPGSVLSSSRGNNSVHSLESNSSPARSGDPSVVTVNSEICIGSNNNTPPHTLQGNPALGHLNSSSTTGNGPNNSANNSYRQQRFPIQHGQSDDSSSHFYEQPKGFSRGGRCDDHFHGGRGRRENRYLNNNNRQGFNPDRERRFRNNWYSNESRFAPPVHPDPPENERTSSAPPVSNNNNESGTNNKGSRIPDSPASSVSSRHLPSNRHQSRSVSESGSSDRGSSAGSRSRSGSRSSVSTSPSSGRSRSPPSHHGSGQFSRGGGSGGSSGGRFHQNSFSRQRYNRSRLVSRPADSSRTRHSHSSRSPPMGGGSRSSSSSSSPSPHRKISTAPHSRSHSPSSTKSYSPSRSLNSSSSHHHHHSQSTQNRRAPSSSELHSAIRIRNLPSRSSDTSLKDGLYHEYKKHGKVAWVRIIGNGAERYAIVCFKSIEHASRAVSQSQDKYFFGCKIQVTPYTGGLGRSVGDDILGGTDDENRSLGEDEATTTTPSRTVFVTGLDSSITPAELRKPFEQYGDIVESKVRKPLLEGSTSSGIIEFVDIGSAIRAQWARHVFKSRETRISFFRNPATNSLILDGTSGMTEKQINGHCCQFGAISRVVMDSDRILAMVQFEEISSAQTAFRELKNWIQKGKPMHVDFASPNCVRLFLDRALGNTANSLNLSPDLRSDSATPPLLTGGLVPCNRRTGSRKFDFSADRRISYKHSEPGLDDAKPVTELSPESLSSRTSINQSNGPESFNGKRSSRYNGTPGDPDIEEEQENSNSVGGVAMSPNGKLNSNSSSSTKIDLNCHETDSAVVTSSSDIICTAEKSPEPESHHILPYPNHNHLHKNNNHSEGTTALITVNGDDHQHSGYESVGTVKSRASYRWSSKSQNVFDGVSSTSPEPKTETVHKVSPDSGIGTGSLVTVEPFPPGHIAESQISPVLLDPRRKILENKTRRSSADSGNHQSAFVSVNSSGSGHNSIYAPVIPDTPEEDSDDRPGTPLCDETPEFIDNDTQSLKRPSKNNDPPLTLPLPGFALARNNSVSSPRQTNSSRISPPSSPTETRVQDTVHDTTLTRETMSPSSVIASSAGVNESDPTSVAPVDEKVLSSCSPSSSPAKSTNVNDNTSEGQGSNTSPSALSESESKPQDSDLPPPPPLPPSINEEMKSDEPTKGNESPKLKKDEDLSFDDEGLISPPSSDCDGSPREEEGGEDLAQRVQNLYQRFDEWDSGNRSVARTLSYTSTNSEDGNESRLSIHTDKPWLSRSKAIDLDELRQQPSDITKSIFSKKSIFDEDIKRLESLNDTNLNNSPSLSNWRLTFTRSSSTTSNSSTTSFPQTPNSASSSGSSNVFPTTPTTPRPHHHSFPLNQGSRPIVKSAIPVKIPMSSCSTTTTAGPLPNSIIRRKDGIPGGSSSYWAGKDPRLAFTPKQPTPTTPQGQTSKIPVIVSSHSHSTTSYTSTPGIHRSVSAAGNLHVIKPETTPKSNIEFPKEKLPGESKNDEISKPLLTTQKSAPPPGIHQGIPRMVERSMSLDSKKVISSSYPILPTTTTTATTATTTTSSVNVTAPTTTVTNPCNSIPATITTTLFGNRRISVESCPVKEAGNISIPNQNHKKIDESSPKPKEKDVKVKDIVTHKPTPSLTIISGGSSNSVELPKTVPKFDVNKEENRLNVQHLQQTTVAVVATTHQVLPVLSTITSSNGSSSGKEKDSNKKDKDSIKKKLKSTTNSVSSSASSPNINGPTPIKGDSSGSNKSSKERKEKISISGKEEKKHEHENSHHSGSGHHHKDKKKDKDTSASKEKESTSNEKSSGSSNNIPAVSHGHKKEKDLKLKRRPTVDSEVQPEHKKPKLDKEKFHEKDKDPASVVENSHHHRIKSGTSTDGLERRESRDSNSSLTKDKVQKEKSQLVGKLENKGDSTSSSPLPPSLKEKSEKTHNHHRSKSTSSSTNSRNHYHEKSEKTSSTSSLHSHNKEKDKQGKKEKASLSSGKVRENSKPSSSSSSSKYFSSHSSSHSSSHHRKEEKESTKISTTSSTSFTKSKSKEKEKLKSHFDSDEGEDVDGMDHESKKEKTKNSSSSSTKEKREFGSSKSKRDRRKSGGDSSSAHGGGGTDGGKGGSTNRKSKEKKRRSRLIEGTDSSTDDENKKHHSIFDVVVDEYVSMYDKVKARSNRACKNVGSRQQQEEQQKKQDKVQDSFQLLKKSRAKREEKKRSTSIDDRKSFQNTSDDDGSHHERESHQDFDSEKSSMPRGSLSIITGLCSSSDEDEKRPIPIIHKHKSHSSKSKSKSSRDGSKSGIKRQKKSSKSSPLRSSAYFLSQSDEDSSPSMKKRKLSSKHNVASLTVLSSPPIDEDTNKSSDDESLSEQDQVNSSLNTLPTPKSSSVKKQSSSKCDKKSILDVYTESDTSLQSFKEVRKSSSSSTKIKKDKSSKQKSMRHIFESSDSSGDEKVVIPSKKEKEVSGKSKGTGLSSSKEKDGKKKVPHHGHGSSSGSKTSKRKRERLSSGETKNDTSSGDLKKVQPTMEDLLFGPMSNSGSEGDEPRKPSIQTLEQTPKTVTPPSVSKPKVTPPNTETPLTTMKKSKSARSRSKQRKNLSMCESLGKSHEESLISNSNNMERSEKKKRKHHKRSKRLESRESMKTDHPVDIDSLFSTPLSSPNKEQEVSTLTLSAASPNNITMYASSHNEIPSVHTKQQSITPTSHRVEEETEKSMFSSDEDDDDKLKIDITEAIISASGENEDEDEEPRKITEPEIQPQPEPAIDETALAAARLLEEEEKKRNSLVEQDKAIESILMERRSPPRTPLGNLSVLSQLQPQRDLDSDYITKDDMKEEPAISQEETEDAVAALLKNLGNDEEIENEDIEKAPASPPTLRIIEESSSPALSFSGNQSSGEGEKESGGVRSTWYNSPAKSPKDLHIDENEMAASIMREHTPLIDESCKSPPLKKKLTCEEASIQLQEVLEQAKQAVAESKKKEEEIVIKQEFIPGTSSGSRRGSNENSETNAGGGDVYEFHDSDDERDRKPCITGAPMTLSPVNAAQIFHPQPIKASTPPRIKSPASTGLLDLAIEKLPLVMPPSHHGPPPQFSPRQLPTQPLLPINVDTTPVQPILHADVHPHNRVQNHSSHKPAAIPVQHTIPTAPLVTTLRAPPSALPRSSVDETIEDVIRMSSAYIPEPEISYPLPLHPAARASPKGKGRSVSKDSDESSTGKGTRVNSPTRRVNHHPQSDYHNNSQLQKHHPIIETRTDSHLPPAQSEAFLIDPQTGVMTPVMRQTEQGQFVPVSGAELGKEHLLQLQSQQAHNYQQLGTQKGELERAGSLERIAAEQQPYHIQIQKNEGLPALLAQQQQQHAAESHRKQHQPQLTPPPGTSRFVPTRSSPPVSSPSFNFGSLKNPTVPSPPMGSRPPQGMYPPSTTSAYSPVALIRPQQDQGVRVSRHQPVAQHVPSPAQLQSQSQLVRIPQIPIATTITKVDARNEERKPSNNQQASTVLLSGAMGPHRIPAHHPLQSIVHEAFGSHLPPRIEISGNTIQVAAGSPKAGRVPQQHEQNPPQSSQHRIHHHPYEAAVGSTSPAPLDLATTPSAHNQSRASNNNNSTIAKATNNNSISSPSPPSLFHHHNRQGDMRVMGRVPPGLEPQYLTGPPPHQAGSYIPYNIPGGASLSSAQHTYGVRPGSVDPLKSQQDQKQLERPATAHLVPHHLSSPHLSDRGSAESPHLIPMYGSRHPLHLTAQPHHSPIPTAHQHQRQTFTYPFEFDEGRMYSRSPVYPIMHDARDRDGTPVGREGSPFCNSQNSGRRPNETPPPAHATGRYSQPQIMPLAEAPTSIERGRLLQVQTPPIGSQVPPQEDALLTLLQRYPIVWHGLLNLKNDNAACQFHFVSGNMSVATDSLPTSPDGSMLTLKISQRMRLETVQLDGVARKLQTEQEHCMLLALPLGHNQMDVLQQSNNLRNGFITYLQLKQAAGIINVHQSSGDTPSFVIHIFPGCDFANENLARIAPDLLNGVADIAHLLIVIATV